jgi:hypothetical protein
MIWWLPIMMTSTSPKLVSSSISPTPKAPNRTCSIDSSKYFSAFARVACASRSSAW